MKEPVLKKLKRYPKEFIYFFGGLYFTFFKRYYRAKGVKIIIPSEVTTFRFRGRFIFEKYEYEESLYINEYLDRESSVLEIGGCLGYVSCLTNNLLKKPENHLVLEANPDLIPWIEQNRELNDCSFIVLNEVVSKKKVNKFFISSIIHLSSLNNPSSDVRLVSGTSIAALQERYNLRFETLIMDIEGGELNFLREHSEELVFFKMIFIEIHVFGQMLSEEEGNECENILSSLGFMREVKQGHFQIWRK
jgi:FkbM family methyltransferase